MKNKNEAAAVIGGERERARMNPLKIDDFGAQLYASNADRLWKNAERSLPKSERVKFKRLFKDAAIVGDIREAAKKSHVSKELLDKFMSVLKPFLHWDAQYRATEILFWAKVSQGFVRGDWLPVAKLAAQKLKVFKEFIRRAAENDNKRFFIDLGKCLSNEIKSKAVDKSDYDLAYLICVKPSISAKNAVRKLEKRGWKINEENFRMRKQRLLSAARAGREAYRQAKLQKT
jgi:hypothetical protein